MFSIFFWNFLILEILHQIFQKIYSKICSSVRGCPPNFISFLALQMLYTVALKLNLHKDPFKLLSFQLRHPSSITSSQLVVGFRTSQSFSHSFQILELKPHRKKRWSRLLVPPLQKTQLVSPVNLQTSIRSPVEGLLLTANQKMKACFGIASWCHASFHQLTIVFSFLR